MKATITVTMSPDEVVKSIPFALITETRFGRTWETSRCRKAWSESFSSKDRVYAEVLFRMARKWFIKGIPDEVEMTSQTLALWLRISEFCKSI